MSRLSRFLIFAMLCTAAPAGAKMTLVGWNNLGMHCMDSDYEVFSILPPYNTIHAQLVDTDTGLVTNPGSITVTYEAVADLDGKTNTTSAGKTNFWDHVGSLFGANVGVDVGLAGSDMPGAGNPPQPMSFDAANDWFIAEGIPITPYADDGAKNYYPMMRLVARNGAGQVLASTDIVLPVSDEMTCIGCHASTADDAARPSSGWANDPDPERDYRLNILRVHDDNEAGLPIFQSAALTAGYDPAGLFATAVGGKSILCASCHASEALPGSGVAGIAPLTQAVHHRMASAIDPKTGLALGASDNRAACYACHPGSETRCLRGAMGAAVAADGSLAMQCQSCHGNMLDVASPDRVGWLEEPNCQGCHTGTATDNAGQIRFTSVFAADGSPRSVTNTTFATTPNTPANGISLYRFSSGHGGLQCSACHGSTHAIFPSAHDSDNVQSLQLQGHVGALAECSTCHASTPRTTNGGPHGLHPLGQSWIDRHPDAVEHGGSAACRACHGADSRGTVLSQAQGDRVLATKYGTKHFWRGFSVGCYDCHRGPSDNVRNPNRAPIVADTSAQTAIGVAVALGLQASDPDGNSLTLRIVGQPKHGAVGLSGTTAHYVPENGFSGEDLFTFAASDGMTWSELGAAFVAVGDSCAGGCTPTPTSTSPAATSSPTLGATAIPTRSPATTPALCDHGPILERARLQVRNRPARLLLTGEAVVPKPWTGIDPLINGVRLRVDSTNGGFDISVPGGSVEDRIGWRVNRAGTMWSYQDKSGIRGGITRIVIRDLSRKRDGLLKISVRGEPTVGTLPSAFGVTAELALGNPGECAVAAWNGPSESRPRCQENDSRLSCR